MVFELSHVLTAFRGGSVFERSIKKWNVITKKEYRDHLLELIGMVDKMPFVAVDQAVENITLFYRLVKELYRIDSEG